MASFADTSGHAGDEGNFEALYETYKSDVQRLASYLLRNATDAEDAAQTVFLNVLRALRQGVTPADPRAWLLAITRNVCFSRKRALSARPLQVELEPELVSSEPDGDAGPSADEIVGALTRLLPNQRTALILRDFRGVSRPEIARLMSITPVALEALLTRARAAFREELEAGDQPFACAETRALVERQLDGLITVADRHSLRTHLRHCASCSTLARAVRSSRGKLAALIFWPGELISRLAAAFSQARTAVHVATALTSTAAIATVAIPVAISTSSPSLHTEGRTAPGPAVAAVHTAPAVTPSQSIPHLVSHAVAAKPAAPARKKTATHKLSTVHKALHETVSKTSRHATHATAAPTATRPSATAPATTSSGGIQTPVQQTAGSTAAPTSGQHPAITLPSSAAPTRSSSPIVRPWSKPKTKPRPSRKAPKKHVRHAPAPVQQMPASSAPAGDMTPPAGGAVDGAGSGVVIGAATSPAVVPSSTSSDAGNTASSSGSGTSSQSGSNGNGSNGGGSDNGNGNHHKHKK